jgi:hypothetical protein
MKLRPGSLIILIQLAALPLLINVVNAQTTRSPKNETASDLQQRRATAMSLLQSLAVDARSYTDEPLRARVQARIADVIWNHDKEAARALFRRAWEIAEGLDHAGADSDLPGRRPGNAGRTQSKASLRREILSLASRCDHTLGEEFLAKLTPRDDADPKTATRQLSSTESAERLRLASELLTTTDTGRALEFAGPALTRINSQAIEFLVSLREKDAVTADRRFASLLTIASADPASDANTVSMLTSYVFTPSIYLVVSRSGIPSSNSYSWRDAPQLQQQLRSAFFEVAAGILMRSLSQIDQSSAGRAGTHFMVMRLLPLFQQFAPDYVGRLNSQLASLGPEAARTTANAGEVALRRGMTAEAEGSNDAELTERLDRAKNSDERDRAYAFAAMRLAEQGNSSAGDLAEKIEDTETRKGVKTFIDYMLIRAFVNKKQPDEALLLLRKADVPRILRAHFLTQVARLKSKDDPVRAVEVLDEALTETRRLDPGTADRPYSLVAVLRQFSVLDKTRAWELLGETIKAANNVDDFTGERSQSVLTLEGKFSVRLGMSLASPTDLTDTLRQLAEENFYQALDVSKTFRGDAPKALAMIAVAGSVLAAQR